MVYIRLGSGLWEMSNGYRASRSLIQPGEICDHSSAAFYQAPMARARPCSTWADTTADSHAHRFCQLIGGILVRQRIDSHSMESNSSGMTKVLLSHQSYYCARDNNRNNLIFFAYLLYWDRLDRSSNIRKAWPDMLTLETLIDTFH